MEGLGATASPSPRGAAQAGHGCTKGHLLKGDVGGEPQVRQAPHWPAEQTWAEGRQGPQLDRRGLSRGRAALPSGTKVHAQATGQRPTASWPHSGWCSAQGTLHRTRDLPAPGPPGCLFTVCHQDSFWSSVQHYKCTIPAAFSPFFRFPLTG